VQIALGEQCDDGNTKAGDGCSKTCQIEAGWSCEVMGLPCSAAKCGDGIQTANEACDDGNLLPTDGCTDTCTVTDGYSCPEPGMPCVLDTVAAVWDGSIETFEAAWDIQEFDPQADLRVGQLRLSVLPDPPLHDLLRDQDRRSRRNNRLLGRHRSHRAARPLCPWR